MINTIEIYTDGACLGNPGDGGFAWVLITEDRRIEHSEYVPDTTNNRMELMAVISVLQYFEKNKKSNKKYLLKIYTDSNLIVQSISQNWLQSWAKNNWIKADKKPVKNIELWVELYRLLNLFDVEFIWVKGHNGDKYNEICDKLAKTAAESKNLVYHQSYTAAPNNSSIEIKDLQIENNEAQKKNQFNFKLLKDGNLIIEQNTKFDFIKKSNSIVINRDNIEEFKNQLEKFVKNL
ncbi:MAG: ribonuclease HI [Candidatus Kapaibacteriota bacterium]